MNRLVFEEVNFINLIKGIKYFIIFKFNLNIKCKSMIDIGTFDKYIDTGLVISEKTAYFINITCFDDNNSNTFKLNNTTYHPYKTRHFFRIIPQKERIQKAMEQRALNTILRNITGDNLFKY